MLTSSGGARDFQRKMHLIQALKVRCISGSPKSMTRERRQRRRGVRE
jgi:hypothetical protein